MTNIVINPTGATTAVTSEIAKPSFSHQIKTIQKRSALLEEYTPVLMELNAAKAKVKLAETQYSSANPNGNLQTDGNKLESEKLKLYRQIISQPTNTWVTNPDQMAFVSQMSAAYQANPEKLQKKERNLNAELTPLQKLYAPDFKAVLTNMPQDAKTAHTALVEKLTNGNEEMPTRGQKGFEDYTGAKSFMEMLDSNAELKAILGTLGRDGQIKVTSELAGEQVEGKRQGRKPMYQLLEDGEFVPMPTPEEQEIAPPLDVNNDDGEAW